MVVLTKGLRNIWYSWNLSMKFAYQYIHVQKNLSSKNLSLKNKSWSLYVYYI